MGVRFFGTSFHSHVLCCWTPPPTSATQGAMWRQSAGKSRPSLRLFATRMPTSNGRLISETKDIEKRVCKSARKSQPSLRLSATKVQTSNGHPIRGTQGSREESVRVRAQITAWFGLLANKVQTFEWTSDQREKGQSRRECVKARPNRGLL